MIVLTCSAWPSTLNTSLGFNHFKSRPPDTEKMVSANVAGALAQIANSSDKPREYELLLVAVNSPTTTPDDLIAISDAIFADSLGIIAIRNLLINLTSLLSTISSDETKIAVGNHILALLANQATSFEEQNAQIRILIADAYEADEEYLAAATALAGIPLESSQRKVTPEDKGRIWIRITRLYLEEDDTTSAETYLNKFKNIIYQVNDPVLRVHFQLSQARIQDARREFLAAAKGYQDISLTPGIAEEERLHTLSMALKCAVLAPAGPARSRALKRLYSDERAPSLEEFGILEKMFLDRLIAPEEVAKFAKGLAPHQLAKTSDGSTVLVKAMGEHNLLGASRLYSNITFKQLGVLLGVDGERAEIMTAKMIEQGRLVGRIDQIEGLIYFERGEATGEKGSGRTEGLVGRELRRWDANVQGLTEEVEKVATALQTQYPVGTTPNYNVNGLTDLYVQEFAAGQLAV
jgi:COP9 signalosome complex subunit 4